MKLRLHDPRLAIAGMALSSIFVVVGAMLAMQTWLFLRDAVRAPATIVDLLEVRGVDDATTFAPVLVFADRDGTEHRVASSLTSWPPLSQVGDRVDVLYAPDDPAAVRLDSPAALWLIAVLPIALGTFGVVVFGLAALLLQARSVAAEPSPGRAV